MTITLYDIPSRSEVNAWSPATWRIRYILNLKGIAHKTEWVEFPDIEKRHKELGIPHSSLKPDGTPNYTVPAIHDPSTGVYLSESTDIAEYLEKTYPNTPIFPHETLGLQWSFVDLFRSTALSALWQFVVPATYQQMNRASDAYFRLTREKMFGKKLEELAPKGDLGVSEWARFKNDLGKVDVWYSKTNGPYLLGDTISWADIVIAAYLTWFKVVFGKDSQEWKDISSWHGGRWGRLVDNLRKYATVV
ncbi:hypothetical protein BDN70DRAFT_798310 [Pholiota conissans]|uniref:GST N-terminal domain-containing protein n=1 Tax=Pholiota conissans TaxID=109636 RepID=A0A9P6CXK3_9AGAR|nr:hypothetical protein BDN70DRAFT_798310 [Pholiota conissans]